ncbi:2-oxo-hept-4-ene-1,7-dioate hydratase [uncultured Hyphomonas sp.]|uniref:2-oxo-hept-4-ene-1,7-dioate hydratase n=1 Tax=uncultured Hyphomonas sp. TaxID=225298 RepID=UPI002AAC120E|nr:2-oxo-hepta-3-ene-1,7-dioic acid hydratase [uncultured Hyphomonas sp.]
MALSTDTISGLVNELEAAEKSRKQIKQFSLRHPDMDISDAYAVQRAWVDMKIAAGAKLAGHKIGLTSRAMQRASNITEPDYGTLLDYMGYNDNFDIPHENFVEPRVEVELAFILKAPLTGPDCTIFDVYHATDYVMPSIEIIDARIQRFDEESGVTRKVFDTISDNAANGGFVLGGRPSKPDDVDLRWISALIHKNGVIEDSGVAAAVLGHPAKGVAWLANKLHPHGQSLQPGQIILSGSFTAPVPAAPGDSFHVDYGPQGSISVRFV